jgi:hypothetical protein
MDHLASVPLPPTLVYIGFVASLSSPVRLLIISQSVKLDPAIYI